MSYFKEAAEMEGAILIWAKTFSRLRILLYGWN
jgi:hypothetical protein